jgi:hypothetical protein
VAVSRVLLTRSPGYVPDGDARGPETRPRPQTRRSDRERRTRSRSAPTYKKVWRDWENEQDGDRNSVMVSRPAAYGLVTAAKAMSDAAGTPWENQVTSQSFINLATTRPDENSGRTMARAVAVQIEWLKAVFAKRCSQSGVRASLGVRRYSVPAYNLQRDHQCT